MLPTPDTSHVPFTHIYEPSEDSYLLLDTLSSSGETKFLHSHFASSPDTPSTTPVVVEVGSGSGVVISFVHANALAIFGTRHVLGAAVDANPFACRATSQTARVAEQEQHASEDGGGEEDEAGRIAHGAWLDVFAADLATPIRTGTVDVLIFNPPYVPTDELPDAPGDSLCRTTKPPCPSPSSASRPPATPSVSSPRGRDASGLSYEEQSYLLSLSYAGGVDGTETTNRLIEQLPDVLSDRGCAYILLCARNRPEEVKKRIQGLEVAKSGRKGEWCVETVGESGAKAGWEKLCIIRVWRKWPSN